MSHSASETEKLDTANLGFWLYLMTDIMIFASLFATYMVLVNATAGGPTAKEIYNADYGLLQTIVLLASSFTCGLAALFLRHRKKIASMWLLGVTMLLGGVFLGLEINEFSVLVAEGHDWQTSAFLTAFFTLVGTHGLHISVGLIWAATVLVHMARSKIDANMTRKMSLFALFWHFLDIIWIFIFTIVYLLGVAI